MIDKEKIIKGLEQCKTVNGKCNECPYDDGLINFTACTSKLCNDALELLKEYEVRELTIVERNVGFPDVILNGVTKSEGAQRNGYEQTQDLIR